MQNQNQKKQNQRKLTKNLLQFNFLILSILLICANSKASAQDTLTLDEVVQRALENNFSLRIQQYDIQIAENNNTIANAGYLPTLGISADQNRSVTYNEQQFYDGDSRITAGAQASDFSATAGLNWTIFDGLNMFYTKDFLEQNLEMTQVEYQLMMEEVLSGVITLYYNIVAEQMALEVLSDAMNLSRERLNLAERGLELGRHSRMDFLQAQTDYITDSIAVVRQYTAIRQLKSDLQTALGSSPTDDDFAVQASIPIREPMDYPQLEENITNQNARIRLAKQNLTLARINTQLAKSQYYPTISAYAGYSYINSSSQAGLLQTQVRRGPDFGITGTFNIFNGFTARRNHQNARIREEAGTVSVQQIELEVANDFNKAWLEYQANLSLLAVEEANLESARENLEIAYGRYRLGAINNIEFRETQRKLLDAEYSYLQTRFLVKSNEVTLIRLSGYLINQN